MGTVLAAIFNAIISWLFSKPKKTASDVFAEQDNQILEDIDNANKIKESIDSKLDGDAELLLPPSERNR